MKMWKIKNVTVLMRGCASDKNGTFVNVSYLYRQTQSDEKIRRGSFFKLNAL